MPQIHRERVLRAATSSFLARGYRSSVDDIARRAGVAKQTVYQHFPSKDELFKEVARDLAKRVLVELERRAARPARRPAALRRSPTASARSAPQGIATFRTAGARGAALPGAGARPCTPTAPARWCAASPST